MLSASMATSGRRSVMEQMLEEIKKHDEIPKDIPPKLPSRPTSKARLSSNIRMRKPLSPFVSQSSEASGVNISKAAVLTGSAGFMSSKSRVSAILKLGESSSSVESAYLISSETGVSMDSRVEGKAMPVQRPSKSTEAESGESFGLGNGFSMDKTSEKHSNGAVEFSGFDCGGVEIRAESLMKNSEFSELQYYIALDSPYKNVDSKFKDKGQDFGCNVSAVERETTEWKDASICGLSKVSRHAGGLNCSNSPQEYSQTVERFIRVLARDWTPLLCRRLRDSKYSRTLAYGKLSYAIWKKGQLFQFCCLG